MHRFIVPWLLFGRVSRQPIFAGSLRGRLHQQQRLRDRLLRYDDGFAASVRCQRELRGDMRPTGFDVCRHH
jgi:hypothetical protein